MFLPSLGYGQTVDDNEVLSRMVNLSKQVHFSDAEGKDLVVPSGPYWIIPEENGLVLFGLLDGQSYEVAATKEEKEEAISIPMAVSIPGSDEEPDTHYVVFMSVDGEQLVAKGSYSGVRSRGILTDRAKANIKAANQAAVKQALLLKGKVQKAATDLRHKAEQAAEARRRKASAEVGKMLQEIATTEAREGRDQALKKAAIYAPRLTALSVIAIPMKDRVQFLTEAKRQLQIHGDFIKEVARRATKIKPLLQDGKRKLSNADIKTIREAIWGSGVNELRHPFAGPTVKPRGIGGGFDPSWAIGGSVGVAAIAGVAIGDAFAMPMYPLDGTCNYFSASIDIGAQEKAAASGSVSFYSGNYRELGASSLDTWSDGPEVAVNLGVTILGGAEVSLLFGWPSAETYFVPPLTGIQIGISGGEEAKVAVGPSYGIRLFCT